MKGIRSVLQKRLLERRRALKTLEIVQSLGDPGEDGKIEITKEQRDEILFSGLSYRQKMAHLRTLKEIEEEKQNKLGNEQGEKFINLG